MHRLVPPGFELLRLSLHSYSAGVGEIFECLLLRTIHAHKPDDRLMERIWDFAHIAPCNFRHIELASSSIPDQVTSCKRSRMPQQRICSKSAFSCNFKAVEFDNFGSTIAAPGNVMSLLEDVVRWSPVFHSIFLAYWKMSFDGRPYSTASQDDIDRNKRAKLYSSGLQTASAL